MTIVEPYEPNVTALLDPAELKWKHLVAPSTPLPTPWPKAKFEEHSDRRAGAPRGNARRERVGG